MTDDATKQPESPYLVTGSVSDSVIQQTVNIHNENFEIPPPLPPGILQGKKSKAFIIVSILILATTLSINLLLINYYIDENNPQNENQIIYQNSTTVVITDEETPLRIASGIVGLWDNWASKNDYGNYIHCQSNWTADGDYPATTCPPDDEEDRDQSSWFIHPRDHQVMIYDSHWKAFSSEIEFNFTIIEDVRFMHQYDEKYNDENNCSANVRAGIISSRAEWIEKVQSVEIPGYCAQIYGIDVDYAED